MIRRLVNLLYTIYFNMRYMPYKQAVHFPILARTNLCVEKLRRGQIEIGDIRPFMVTLGGGKSPAMNSGRACIYLSKNAKLIFRGHANISEGTVLRCDKNGIIEFGKDFYCNCNCYFRTSSKISFGDDCAVGWNCTINTSDGHHVWHDGKEVEMEGPVKVGNRVWITSEVTINKHVHITDNCVVAQRAVVTKPFYETHCLIGGIPAKVISRGIKWKK